MRHNRETMRLEREAHSRSITGGGAVRALAVGDDMAGSIVARWNAVLDALAEYNDPNKDNVRCTGDRMADILRNALDA